MRTSFGGSGGRKRIWQLAANFIYGQVKKLHRRRWLVKVERVMLCGSFEVLANRLKAVGLSGRLNTAFVERLNLTPPLAGKVWLC